jgi:hypothetical protein
MRGFTFMSRVVYSTREAFRERVKHLDYEEQGDGGHRVVAFSLCWRWRWVGFF